MRLASLMPYRMLDGTLSFHPVWTYFAPHKLQGTPARHCKHRGAPRLFKGWRP